MTFNINGAAFLLDSPNAVIGGGNNNAATSVPADNAAEGTGEEVAAGGFMSFLPMILMWGGLLVVMYLLMFRPQRKREKAAREMRDALRVGDNVVTTAGFYGKIVELGTDAHVIEFGSVRGVRVAVRKTDISGVAEPVLTPPVKKD